MNCINCSGITLQKTISTKDYFLSQEPFEVHRCPQCGLHATQPVPSLDKLSDYYKSEDYLSHGAQKSGLFAWAYRQAKRYNLSSKARLLSPIKRAGELLDYGCGTGDFITHMQALGYQVRGAEPSAEALQHASALVRNLINSPREELKSSRTYDLITLWHVLEHIPEPQTVLKQLARKLHPQGHLIIAVPNPSSGDAKHYGTHWAGWDVPRHLWHFEPESMIRMVEALGLKHIDTRPMWLDAFYVSMLSEKYKKGTTPSALFHAAKSNLKALSDKKRKCSSQIYLFQVL